MNRFRPEAVQQLTWQVSVEALEARRRRPTAAATAITDTLSVHPFPVFFKRARRDDERALAQAERGKPARIPSLPHALHQPLTVFVGPDQIRRQGAVEQTVELG